MNINCIHLKFIFVKKYPCKDGFSDLGWSSLLKDLQRSSLCQGFSIASCGYDNKKNNP